MYLVIEGNDLPLALVSRNDMADIPTAEEPDAQHHYNIHNAIG
jgi:hypothetical protein